MSGGKEQVGSLDPTKVFKISTTLPYLMLILQFAPWKLSYCPKLLTNLIKLPLVPSELKRKEKKPYPGNGSYVESVCNRTRNWRMNDRLYVHNGKDMFRTNPNKATLHHFPIYKSSVSFYNKFIHYQWTLEILNLLKKLFSRESQLLYNQIPCLHYNIVVW